MEVLEIRILHTHILIDMLNLFENSYFYVIKVVHIKRFNATAKVGLTKICCNCSTYISHNICIHPMDGTLIVSHQFKKNVSGVERNSQ